MMINLTQKPHLFDVVRGMYSISDVRRDLRIELPEGALETYSDVVLLVSDTLSGGSDDWTAAKEWFGERVGIDCPEAEFSLDSPSTVSIVSNRRETRISRLKARPIASLRPKAGGKRESLVATKNTDNGKVVEKTPTMVLKKAQTMGCKKTPTDTIPVELWGVVSNDGLKGLLIKHRQEKWATRVRLSGLLILVNFMVKLNRKKRGGKGFRISQRLARNYVSDLIERPSQTSIREPLNVLKAIGLIDEVEPFKFSPYQTCSARFQFGRVANAPFKHSVELSPKNHQKLKLAKERKNDNMNKKFPWYSQLMADLGKVALSSEGLNLAIDLVTKQKKESNTKLLLALVGGGQEHWASGGDSSGTISTGISCCPRELKPHLILAGDPVALCDISHAHWCLLPILAEEQYLLGISGKTSGDLPPKLVDEIGRLVDYLSEGDLYQKFGDGQGREEAKGQMLKALNYPNAWNQDCHPYQEMRGLFPLSFRLIEQIKDPNHKALSIRLRSHTAKVIKQSLLECQEKGIPAIPDTDCIICPAEHQEAVCHIVGAQMYQLTEVKCLVGGIRYDPSAVSTKSAAQSCSNH